MTVTGFDEETAIYVYYAPALIANTITIAKKIKELSLGQTDVEDFHRDGWTVGLFYALYKLAAIYEDVSTNELSSLTVNKDGAGTHFYHADKDAKNILDNADYHQRMMKQLMLMNTNENDEM